MAAFDRLPEAVRHILQSSVVNWCAGEAFWSYLGLRYCLGSQGAASIVVNEYRIAEEDELIRWNRRYRRKFKTHTAHHLAGATIMRPSYRRQNPTGTR